VASRKTQQRSRNVNTSPTLLSALRAAACRPMTPAERREQRISYIVSETGYSRDQVAAWLDKHVHGEQFSTPGKK
jgi:hypothetical protein